MLNGQASKIVIWVILLFVAGIVVLLTGLTHMCVGQLIYKGVKLTTSWICNVCFSSSVKLGKVPASHDHNREQKGE